MRDCGYGVRVNGGDGSVFFCVVSCDIVKMRCVIFLFEDVGEGDMEDIDEKDKVLIIVV